MFNKILVFGGLALAAILVVENAVITNTSYVFLAYSTGGILAIVSTLIGIGIGYGVKGMSETITDDEDDLNF